MALKSLIFKNGDVYLNSLKRFCLSGVVVPRQELAVAKIPAASSATQPGRSPIIPLQGPGDATSEVFSYTGKQGVTAQGVGLITTSGGTTVTGTGTSFLTQVQPGDSIIFATGSDTVATVVSNTVLTTVTPIAVTDSLYFILTNISTANAPKVFVTIEDVAWRRKLMNRDVPAMHVFGSNRKPLLLKESILLETDQTLLAQFLNYGSTAASFAPMAECRKWQFEALKDNTVGNYISGRRERVKYLQPYWLTLDKGTIALDAAGGANASATAFFTCTGDITLELFNRYMHAFNSSGIDRSRDVLVSFLDAKTQRSLQTQPMPLEACSGTAEDPFRQTPWMVEPQGLIQANFTNISTDPVNVYATFHGVACYTGTSFHGSTLTNKHLNEEADRMYRAMSIPQIIPASSRG